MTYSVKMNKKNACVYILLKVYCLIYISFDLIYNYIYRYSEK